MTQLTLNGEQKNIQATTLAEAVLEFGYADAKIATALNGTFVPAADRPQTNLVEGDRIEIVAPMQGG